MSTNLCVSFSWKTNKQTKTRMVTRKEITHCLQKFFHKTFLGRRCWLSAAFLLETEVNTQPYRWCRKVGTLVQGGHNRAQDTLLSPSRWSPAPCLRPQNLAVHCRPTALSPSSSLGHCPLYNHFVIFYIFWCSGILGRCCCRRDCCSQD